MESSRARVDEVRMTVAFVVGNYFECTGLDSCGAANRDTSRDKYTISIHTHLEDHLCPLIT